MNIQIILYNKDVQHWAGSSSDTAVCSVEPGSVSDLSKIVSLSILYFTQMRY